MLTTRRSSPPTRPPTSLWSGSAICCGSRCRLLDVEQFDLKVECRVGRNDTAGTARAVAKVWGNNQRPFATDFHTGHTFVPALNDLTASERECEWLVAVLGAVEPGAVEQPAGVVDRHELARLGLGARANLVVGVFEPVGHSDLLSGGHGWLSRGRLAAAERGRHHQRNE